MSHHPTQHRGPTGDTEAERTAIEARRDAIRAEKAARGEVPGAPEPSWLPPIGHFPGDPEAPVRSKAELIHVAREGG